jgi:hypothetical protein
MDGSKKAKGTVSSGKHATAPLSLAYNICIVEIKLFIYKPLTVKIHGI